jgi:hypothetical protein
LTNSASPAPEALQLARNTQHKWVTVPPGLPFLNMVALDPGDPTCMPRTSRCLPHHVPFYFRFKTAAAISPKKCLSRAGELVISCVYTPEVFQPAKATLDDISTFVGAFVEVTGRGPSRPLRSHVKASTWSERSASSRARSGSSHPCSRVHSRNSASCATSRTGPCALMGIGAATLWQRPERERGAGPGLPGTPIRHKRCPPARTGASDGRACVRTAFRAHLCDP